MIERPDQVPDPMSGCTVIFEFFLLFGSLDFAQKATEFASCGGSIKVELKRVSKESGTKREEVGFMFAGSQ